MRHTQNMQSHFRTLLISHAMFEVLALAPTPFHLLLALAMTCHEAHAAYTMFVNGVTNIIFEENFEITLDQAFLRFITSLCSSQCITIRASCRICTCNLGLLKSHPKFSISNVTLDMSMEHFMEFMQTAAITGLEHLTVFLQAVPHLQESVMTHPAAFQFQSMPRLQSLELDISGHESGLEHAVYPSTLERLSLAIQQPDLGCFCKWRLPRQALKSLCIYNTIPVAHHNHAAGLTALGTSIGMMSLQKLVLSNIMPSCCAECPSWCSVGNIFHAIDHIAEIEICDHVPEDIMALLMFRCTTLTCALLPWSIMHGFNSKNLMQDAIAELSECKHVSCTHLTCYLFSDLDSTMHKFIQDRHIEMNLIALGAGQGEVQL